ncbi:MAG TPA: cytochrome c oxidase subunit 4 [Micromonosporaceae bacterium]|nr:cytochrome c oxidase subunit 4 [Micromonosporaceae bacterium]
MKTEWKIFGGLTAFLLLIAAIYGWWTWFDSRDAGSANHMEFVGTVALILSALLTMMMGGYFWFVSRRIDLRPEDRPEAEIVDGAGEIGFFSPSSYWPFGLALAAAVTAYGAAVWMAWLMALGVAAVLAASAGLLFEYYTGSRRSAEH